MRQIESHDNEKQISCQIHADAIFELWSGFSDSGGIEKQSESLVCDAHNPRKSLRYLRSSHSNGKQLRSCTRALNPRQSMDMNHLRRAKPDDEGSNRFVP